MTEIPRWKVQAALQLLGLDPTDAMEVRIYLDTNHPVIAFDGFKTKPADVRIVDEVPDNRMHVLGMDPETGDAVLTVCPDDDVKFYAGAKMYLHSGVKHANGTLCPVFKKADA